MHIFFLGLLPSWGRSRWKTKQVWLYIGLDLRNNSLDQIAFNEQYFDVISLFDVLEHLPNPYNVIKNIYDHLNDNAVIIETWVSHGDDGPGEADLEEAEAEREITTKFLDENFRTLEEIGEMRIRRKI